VVKRKKDEDERLEELFNRLEGKDTASLLDKIPDIRLSPDFRPELLARIETLRNKRSVWVDLIPHVSWSKWAFGSLVLALAWAAGFQSGANLYNKDKVNLKNHTELGLSVFGSLYNLNSIEAWLVKSAQPTSEEYLP